MNEPRTKESVNANARPLDEEWQAALEDKSLSIRDLIRRAVGEDDDA